MSFIRNIIAHQVAKTSIVRPRLPGKFESFIPGELDSEIAAEQESTKFRTEFAEDRQSMKQIGATDSDAKQQGVAFGSQLNAETKRVNVHSAQAPLATVHDLSGNTVLHQTSDALSQLPQSPTSKQATAISETSMHLSSTFHTIVDGFGINSKESGAAITGQRSPAEQQKAAAQNEPWPVTPESRLNAFSESGLHASQPVKKAFNVEQLRLQTVPEPSTVIKVSIGRIEVKAIGAANNSAYAGKQAVKSELKPKMSLEEYLKSRNSAS